MAKTVSIFVSTIGSGGAEKQAAILAKALSNRYNVIFIALFGEYESSKTVESILEESGAKVYLLNGSWLNKVYKLCKIINKNKVFCIFNYLTQCDFVGAIVARFCGVKKIFNGIRNSDMETYKILIEKFSHNFIATRTIFNSFSGEQSFIKRGLNRNKCITIPNCFVNISNAKSRDDKKIKSIITVGRFVPQKDYETAIRAIAELKKFRNDFVFNIVGYGQLENQIKDWVESYEVSDVVRFYIHSQKIAQLLNESDIYLSTSLFEGTSNSIMEAMNSSLPVVATDVGDNSNLIRDQYSGYILPIEDFKGISFALDKLLSDVNLRNTMGNRANSILKDNYSFDGFRYKYVNIIENL